MNVKQEEIVKENGWTMPLQYIHRYIRKGEITEFTNVHYHEYIEILYGISGTAKVMVDEAVYDMGVGDMVIVPAHSVHDVCCMCGETHYHVVKFLPHILYDQDGNVLGAHCWLPYLTGSLPFEKAYTSKNDVNGTVSRLIDEIASEISEKKQGYELICTSNTVKAIVLAMRACAPEIQSVGMSESLLSALEKVLHETRDNLDFWNAKKAARACGLSYSYFSRSFKLAFGISYSQYLEIQRLRHADYLLKNSDKSISEISEILGFETVSYFIDRFKARRGVTPLAFRKNTPTVSGEKLKLSVKKD